MIKITNGNVPDIGRGNVRYKENRGVTGLALGADKKVDTITISTGEHKTDMKFIEALKTQILNEVKAGAGIHKLNDLRNQVAAGEYDINPVDIVRKMMLE